MQLRSQDWIPSSTLEPIVRVDTERPHRAARRLDEHPSPVIASEVWV
jgi:hypothetical protein